MKKHPFLAQDSRYCQAKQRRKHRYERDNDLQYAYNYILHNYPIKIFVHTTSDTKFRKQSSSVT